MKLYEVYGDSMWPYLKSHDMLEVEPLTHKPQSGDLILVESKQSQKRFIHRYINSSLIKGDNNPWGDQTCHGQSLKIISSVKARWIPSPKGQLRCINYTSSPLPLLHKAQAYLSQLNEDPSKFTRKIFHLVLLSLSASLRLYQNTFARRPS